MLTHPARVQREAAKIRAGDAANQQKREQMYKRVQALPFLDLLHCLLRCLSLTFPLPFALPFLDLFTSFCAACP